MNDAIESYLAEDRRAAIALGKTLPDRVTGSALLADISGFTRLGERLTEMLGAKDAAEELTRRIDAIYDALIVAVERHDGSVVSFAGDALTCWFDDSDGDAPRRALLCARTIQTAMPAVEALAVKVAVASGSARRFVVGDPNVQLFDTLAGELMCRLSVAEQLTQPGECLIDTATSAALGSTEHALRWRTAADGARFALLDAAAEGQLQTSHRERIPAVVPHQELLKPWLLRAAYERVCNTYDALMVELRPTVALFMRFHGIEYDSDGQACSKLDAIVCRAQSIADECGGALLQLTIGDKGSYFYVSFGALAAHEDDALRAVRSALTLNRLGGELPFIESVGIGIAAGTMRVGAYGGRSRRTFGALGDDTNLAARLMSIAGADEILISGRVHKVVAEAFDCEPRAPLALKGKSKPLPVFAVAGARRRRAMRLEEPVYALPMMGRRSELAIIDDCLHHAAAGNGQVIGLVAEAGMGKSRLVAETIRLARRRGFSGYGGACEASGTAATYSVWKSIWQAFFDLDPAAPSRRRIRQLQTEIDDRAASRREAMPVLSSLVELPIDDNEFTRGLEPKDRRNVLSALLEDCIASAAAECPLLFVLEDLHWIDPASRELLETLVRASVYLPVCFVLASRPLDSSDTPFATLERLPQFTRLTLAPLTSEDIESFIRAKLAQLFPEGGGALPQWLIDELNARSEGNPFYLEELLNYLHDRNLDVRTLGEKPGDDVLDLPTSLQALILSRIDQLTGSQRATLKIASIIGRLFRVDWLHGYYPALGEDRMKADLAELRRLDITLLDTPEPELAYLFKHVITRQVTYESLPRATREQLHDQLARFIESLDADRYVDLLAYHYGLSRNTDKQREYLLRAGEAAQAVFANDAAIDYYRRLLPLLTDTRQQHDVQLKLAAVLQLVGRFPDAESACRVALALSEQLGDAQTLAADQQAIGNLLRARGDFVAGMQWLQRACEGWQSLGATAQYARALVDLAYLCYKRDDYGAVRHHAERAAQLALKADDAQMQASAANALGLASYRTGEWASARSLFEQALSIWRRLGNEWESARTLMYMASVSYDQGDYQAARLGFERALALDRRRGDKLGIAIELGNVANAVSGQGDYDRARQLMEEGLVLCRELDNAAQLGIHLSNCGYLALSNNDPVRANGWLREAVAVCREAGAPWIEGNALNNLGCIELVAGDVKSAVALFRRALLLRSEIGDRRGIVYSLIAFAAAAMQLGNRSRAAELSAAVVALRRSVGMTLYGFLAELHERTLAECRAASGSFDAEWSHGEQLTFDQAVQLALET